MVASPAPSVKQLTEQQLADLRGILPRVADQTVDTIVEEVPSYSDALSGRMGETIRMAVQLAHGGFISLVSRGPDSPRAPTAEAVDGAYQLGRGEARSGRSVDALLAAYRIGARVAWREMSATAVASGVDAHTVAWFAELVFAYIDQLSAASVAGHNDEQATTGRVRQRLLERVARHLLEGGPADVVEAAAERAGWPLPRSLTAVLAPESQVRPVLAALAGESLVRGEEVEGRMLLMVPDVHGRARASLLRALAGRGAVAGPARPWLEVRSSYERAVRAAALGLGPDTEEHLPALVLTADPAALADLRARALAPMSGLRPAAAEKLADTLRAWLLHHGRRDDIAASLFVHPQTVRYRMSQLRELYGAALEDPDRVLELTLALAVPQHGETQREKPDEA